MGYAPSPATVGDATRGHVGSGRVWSGVAGGLGVAWSLATFLVAPVLVDGRPGPVSAIGRSTGLLRQTWGEQVGGRVGIGLVFGVQRQSWSP